MLKINKERNILMKNDNINEKDEKFTEVTPKYYSIDNRYEEYNKPPKKKKSAKKAVAVTSACIIPAPAGLPNRYSHTGCL